jgi:hypothetical protein
VCEFGARLNNTVKSAKITYFQNNHTIVYDVILWLKERTVVLARVAK